MEYTCEIEIDLPRSQVIALFDNPANLTHWQEGLESFKHVSGEVGQPGSVSEIVYQMGRRRLEMTETIEIRNLPREFTAIYRAKGVWNRVENLFEEHGDRTRWTINTVFRCRGFLRVMAFLMPGMFRKQTMKMMRDFKNFAETR